MARQPRTKAQGATMQWRDMHPEERTTVEQRMGETGNAPERMTTEIGRLKSKPTLAPKEKVALASYQLAAPGVRRVPVSINAAASRRGRLYDRAVESAPGAAPEGAGWYFNHRSKLDAMASEHGVHSDTAITASAVMSPNNSPDNELAATKALMEAHSNHAVHMTPELHSHLASAGVPLHPTAVGRTIPFRDLHPDTVAALSSTQLREHVQTTAGAGTGRLLTDISRGGTKNNISKAVHVLRGNIAPDDAIHPETAPKVWSYRHDIRNAVPNSPEHVEYMSRVESHASQTGVSFSGQHPVTGAQAGPAMHGTAMQESFDLYGLRHATHGPLDPEGHTAEDTWQNSITSGQPLAQMPTGRRGRASGISPAKTYGSGDRLGATGPSDQMHAFNNRATIVAAQRASRGTGFRLPATAMQEVGWTQARKEAGADTAHNAALAAASARPKPPEQIHGQMDIYGGVARTGQRAAHSLPSNVVSPTQFGAATDPGEGRDRVKAEAAASAIHRNTMAKRRRTGRSTDTSAKALGNEPYEGWG